MPRAKSVEIGEENGVDKAVEIQNVKVSVDNTYEQILGWNIDPGIRLFWDEDRLRELPPEIEGRLSRDNLKRYLTALAKFQARVENAVKNPKVEMAINPLGMNAEFRLKIRPRRGWHQCWKTPGLELDAALAGPYKQVRKLKVTGKDASGNDTFEKVEAGYETGEVLKLNDEQSKVELVAVECPQELFEQYVEYMAKKSRDMYSGNKERFAENIEEMNRSLDKDKRIGIVGD